MLCDEINRIKDMVVDLVENKMEQVQPLQIGLDQRCAPVVYVCEDAVAVDKSYDRRLQYFGGFEYVAGIDREEIGDYVFYFVDDERVAGHLARYYSDEINCC